MANYRVVKQTFWTDAKVQDDMTPEDKYFYLYLLTNPHSNLCGCYEISFKAMGSELGYETDTVKRLVKRFTEIHKVIDYDPNTKEILIVNWAKNNWTTSEKYLNAVEKEIETIKSDKFSNYLKLLISDTVSIPYTYPMDTTIYITNTITNTINNKKVEKKHQYGEYKNVLLTDIERDKLQDQLGSEFEDFIERLSSYIESKGAKYKSHYATILNWYRKEKEKTPKGRNDFIDEW